MLFKDYNSTISQPAETAPGPRLSRPTSDVEVQAFLFHHPVARLMLSRSTVRSGGGRVKMLFLSRDFLYQQTGDESAVDTLHRQVQIPVEPAALGDDQFPSDGVTAGLVVVLPIDAGSPLLPIRQVVEVDPVLKQSFIFFSNGTVPQGRRGGFTAQAGFPQRPITVGIEGIAMGVFTAPTKIIDDVRSAG